MNQKHLFQMLAVCLGVIVMGFAMVTFFDVAGNSALFLGLLILCPLSHLLMMRSMYNDHARMGNDHARMGNNHTSMSSKEHQMETSDHNSREEKSNVQNCH